MPTDLSPAAVRERLDGPEPVALLDVRPKLDYCDGHVEWATRVPRRELERRLPRLVPDPAVEVILVDRVGDRAPRDAAWLERLGYDSVSYLDGGMAAWRDGDYPTVEAVDGVPNTALNVPSKRFGERVHVERDLPTLSPEEFADLREREDVLVTDVRTPGEYESGALPDAVNVEGVNLARSLPAIREADQPVVVNCAGRTRSIIGTATLHRMGVEDVYELENGTMGWQLAGFEVEEGADRRVVDPDLDDDARHDLEAFADDLLAEHDVPRASIDEFERRRTEGDVTYVVDVRSTGEYEAGHLPGSISIPGGQAIQTTDEHFAVHPAEVVFVSDTYLRAAVTAYWFAEMGFDSVAVLDGGIEAWTADDRPLETGPEQTPELTSGDVEEPIQRVSPEELHERVEDGTVSAIDVDASWRFAERHLPGAHWVDRYEVEAAIDGADRPDESVVLTSRDGSIAELAAAFLAWDRGRAPAVLDGGVDAWVAAGYPVESGEPAGEVRDDFEKPWRQGVEAMRTYLEWELEMGEEYAE